MAETIQQVTYTVFEVCFLCCIGVIFVAFIGSLLAYLYDWAHQE